MLHRLVPHACCPRPAPTPRALASPLSSVHWLWRTRLFCVIKMPVHVVLRRGAWQKGGPKWFSVWWTQSMVDPRGWIPGWWHPLGGRTEPMARPLLLAAGVSNHVGRWVGAQVRSRRPGSASCFSTDCESLIRRMLVVDPARRITIAQIRQHRWMRAEPCLPGPACSTFSAHSYSSNLGDYDEQALGIMQTLGVDRQRTVEVSPATLALASPAGAGRLSREAGTHQPS